ncbi:MAG: hypothetical protein J6V72_12135 [Kiritimatiellae bacterium]|nr:hypothetical protein [Kiritimatiellia bacterium]
MAALGAGAGAFEGDTTRAKLALEAQRLRQTKQQHSDAMNLRQQQIDMEREQSERRNAWGDALHQQQSEEHELKMQAMRDKMTAFQTVRAEEMRQMENRRNLVKQNVGVAVLAALPTGFLTNEQVKLFNKENGTNYTAITAVNPLTNKPFENGGLHMVTLGKGADGRPALTMDNRISDDFVKAVTESEFGKEILVGDKPKTSGGWSPERLDFERERLAQRKSEEEGRNTRAGSKNDLSNTRIAASIAKNMRDIKRGLNLSDDQATALQTSLTKILTDAFSPASDDKTPIKGGDNSGRARQIGSPSEMNDAPVGSWFEKGGRKYVKQANGRWE